MTLPYCVQKFCRLLQNAAGAFKLKGGHGFIEGHKGQGLAPALQWKIQLPVKLEFATQYIWALPD